MSYQPPYDDLPPPEDPSEAVRRADFFRNRDPFPDIPRALLAGEDVEKYVRVTGMLYPFYTDGDRLKPASYEARAREFTWWDEEGHKNVVAVVPGKPYVLRANTIAFARIDSTIRLPDYIALRFNLRIKHVHRGMLLGTGPMVDPGFRGDLLIPLHNLTSDNFEISCEEGLIWIEFTKTSRDACSSDAKGAIEEHKTEVPPEVYFERANKNNPIRSSIPQAVRDAQEQANRARDDAKIAKNDAQASRNSAQRFLRIGSSIGVLAFLAVAVALVALYLQVNGVVVASNSLTASVSKDTVQAGFAAKQALDRAGAVQRALNEAKRQIDALQIQVRQQAAEISRLRQGR